MDVQADDGASLREVMASYPTGVTIVAASDDRGVPYGLTVNSFTSVSLKPPLVLVCIGHTSTSHDRLMAAPAFTINVLSARQEAIAGRFAREPSTGRFDEVAWKPGAWAGTPVLDGVVAWLECERYEVVEGGDHSILIGRVRNAAVHPHDALLFHRGRLSSSGA
jgi:flavin reductase (DIM6/NTAB) family NADH-FMN oxidoreductase RutF